MRYCRVLFLILLVAWANRSYADESAALPLQVTWLGTDYSWREPQLKTSPPVSWQELEHSNQKELRLVSGALGNLARERRLDDFGTFMLVRSLALNIRLDGLNRPRRFHDAWGKSWDERSRAYFVYAVLNQLNYRAVLFTANGRMLIGIPTTDTELNARTSSITIERSFFGVKKALQRTYLLWDVQGRIGDPQTGPAEADLATPLETIFERDAGRPVDFRRREIPEELTARKTTAVLRWPGGRAAAFNVYPDLARYLELYPEHHFAAQMRLEKDEIRRTGLAHSLKTFAAGVPEDRFVTELLQAVQISFRYSPGPLRSVHEILASGEGDCDQLAAVLALLLLEAGYSQDAIAAVIWNGADHMGLAIRPKNKAPAGGAQLTLRGNTFYILDPTFYRKRESEIITAWGDMNPDNAGLAATIQYLDGKP
jgi:hypothetical protein